MKEWEKRLNHFRVMRDAYVACGNEAPKEPDPPGGLRPVDVRVFKGSVFYDYISQHGHTDADFVKCECNK